MNLIASFNFINVLQGEDEPVSEQRQAKSIKKYMS